MVTWIEIVGVGSGKAEVNGGNLQLDGVERGMVRQAEAKAKTKAKSEAKSKA